MTLHTKLVSLRKQKGLTQLDLATRLNVSRQAVSRWESGLAVPSTDNLKVLSNLYGVSLDYLLNDDAGNPHTKAQEQTQGPEEQVLESKEQRSKGISKKHMIIFTCVFILIISIVVIIGVTKPNEPDQQQIIPIEEMDNAIEYDYPEGTFSID